MPPHLPPKRYTTTSIPATYGRQNSLPPGTVVGIVLGSVFGFIFLLYLLYLALSSGRRMSPDETATEISASLGSHRSHRRQRRRDMVEVEEEGGERDGRGNIVVEESVSRSDGGDVVEVIEEHSSVEGGGRRPPRRSRGWRRGGYEDSEYGSSRY